MVNNNRGKKFLVVLFLLCILGLTIKYRKVIIDFFMRNFFDNEKVSFGEKNAYYRDYDYEFVQNTDNLYPSNRQDILNIIYSTLNRGLNEVTFYCDDGFNDCIDQVNNIAENKEYLSAINNLVHPFNSYHNIYFSISSYGKVKISIKKNYSDSEILLINNKLDSIIASTMNDNMSIYDKIVIFHDYIVNNTVYDDTVSLESQLYIDTNSNSAVGLLFEGKAICSGYTDTMAIFLDKIGVNNYKISSDVHIWNLVYLDGWKHIDATWDDPITVSGNNVLLHDFFMINSNELLNKDNDLNKFEHNFNQNFYIEAKSTL